MKPRLIHVSGNGLSCRYLRHCATRSPRTARERFVFFFFTFISLRYNIPARNFTRASSVTARGCTSNTLARPRYGRSRDARKSSFLESNESLGFSCWGKSRRFQKLNRSTRLFIDLDPPFSYLSRLLFSVYMPLRIEKILFNLWSRSMWLRFVRSNRRKPTEDRLLS